MNRKNFLKSIGVLTSSLAAAPLFSHPLWHRPSAQTFKKGLGFWMIDEDLSVLDKFKLAKDIGFHGIEFNSPLEMPMKELLDARDQTGIEIPSTVNTDHWSKPLSDPDPDIRRFTIDSVCRSLKETKNLGGDTVLVVPGVVSDEVSYKSAYENALGAIRQIIPHAEKTGVQIGLENVWNNFILSPVEAKAFLEEIDHPLVGWYFDLGNILRYGWPEHWLELLDDKIFKLHVKEFSIEMMNEQGLSKGFNVELGEGDVNWPNVMKTIRALAYKGEYLTLEIAGGDRTHLAKLSQQLDMIIAS